MKFLMIKVIAWGAILFIMGCIVLQLTSCSTINKSRRSETTSRDSSAHTTFTGTKTTKIEEMATRPVITNPGDYSGVFDLRDTGYQVFETENYTVRIKAGGAKASKTGKGKVDITGKDKKIDVPVTKTTTITETGIRKEKTQVKEEIRIKTFDKKKTGAPGWLWIAGILIALAVFGTGGYWIFRKVK